MTTPAHEWIRCVSRPHAITWVAGTLFAMVGGCAGDRPAPTAGATLVLHQVARGRSDSVDTRLETLALDRDWFPPLEADWDGGTSKPYPTVLRDIHQDRSGHLVVILERARPDSPTMPGAGGRESGVTISLVERLASLEQVIEVLDPDTGALIASTPGPRDVFLMRSLEDDRIVGIGTDPSGRDLPVVYELVHPKTFH